MNMQIHWTKKNCKHSYSTSPLYVSQIHSVYTVPLFVLHCVNLNIYFVFQLLTVNIHYILLWYININNLYSNVCSTFVFIFIFCFFTHSYFIMSVCNHIVHPHYTLCFFFCLMFSFIDSFLLTSGPHWNLCTRHKAL